MVWKMGKVAKRVADAVKTLAGVKSREVSQAELLRMQGDNELLSSALRGFDINAEAQASGEVNFVYATTVDPKIQGYFDPGHPNYNKKFEALAPLFTTTPFLSNYTEQQSRTYRLMANVLFTQVKNNDLTAKEFQILQGLKVWYYMKLNDGVQGYKMDKLTTQKKAIVMSGIEERKK